MAEDASTKSIPADAPQALQAGHVGGLSDGGVYSGNEMRVDDSVEQSRPAKRVKTTINPLTLDGTSSSGEREKLPGIALIKKELSLAVKLQLDDRG